MQTEQNEEGNNGNIFRRAGQQVKKTVGNLNERIHNVGVMAQEDMRNTLIRSALPFVKRALPDLTDKLKGYLQGVTGTPENTKKLCVLRIRDDGAIVMMIFDESKTSIVNKNGADPAEMCIAKHELDEYLNKFMSGEFDGATHEM